MTCQIPFPRRCATRITKWDDISRSEIAMAADETRVRRSILAAAASTGLDLTSVRRQIETMTFEDLINLTLQTLA